MLPGPIQSRLEEIWQNRNSGAAELAVQAADALIQLAGDPAFSRPMLVEAARALVRAQPAMAPIFNLANAALWSAVPAEACRQFISQVRSSTAAVARRAESLIGDGTAVLTHSHSSTVLAALSEAQQAGRRFSAICTESRPGGEGLRLAEALGREGVAVTLIIDAAVYWAAGEARLALVGADSISTRGVTNKTGTALLALAARERGVPLYAICGSEKFLPEGWEPPAEPPKDPRELLARAPPGVKAVNFYFETTPLALFAGIITEDGTLEPGETAARLARSRVHPDLA